MTPHVYTGPLLRQTLFLLCKSEVGIFCGILTFHLMILRVQVHPIFMRQKRRIIK